MWCGKYIYTIYQKITKQQFISNKIYFSNIVDEFVVNEHKSWKLFLHYQDIVNYWWREEGVDHDQFVGFANDWMMDPIQLYLKRVVGIGIENDAERK